MRLAYADPPYPGQAKRHYSSHPDYGGEVDHVELLERLSGYDGWALHTSSPALEDVYAWAREAGADGYRTMAWVKPFCAFKSNVPVAYSWEPVLVKTARKPVVSGRIVMRDHVSECITMRKGLVGAKPPAVCRWVFEVMGSEPGDTLDDLYPGTGIVMKTWNEWVQAQDKDPLAGLPLAGLGGG